MLRSTRVADPLMMPRATIETTLAGSFGPLEDDIARMRAALLTRLGSQPDAALELALAQLKRLSGSAWAMEWNLARWLGSGFGLAEATQRRLVMANA
ncbi:MAG: hypothetical protein WBR18_15530, partial [Anaerolineales bacterium]